MSGGHFEYKQHELDLIADDIRQLIRTNNKKDQWDWANNYSENTLEEFKKAVHFLKLAKRYTQRIDWLVSGDDSEESFHERLKEDLEEL